MKKYIFLAAMVALSLCSCRKMEHDVPNPDSAEVMTADHTYTGQFRRIWQGIDVGYVFWKWDTVDWDAVYAKYLPEFEAADERVRSGEEGMSEDEFCRVWGEIITPLKDHHMTLYLGRPDITGPVYRFDPSKIREQSSDFHRKFTKQEHLGALCSMIDNHSLDAVIDTVSFKDDYGYDSYAIYALINGNIPYFYISSFGVLPPNYSATDPGLSRVLGKWMEAAVFNSDIKGAILDTRNNNGGKALWMDFLGSYFSDSEFTTNYRYVKSNVGRLDYASPIPYTVKPAQQYRVMSDECPFVCLFDQNSSSCAEETPWMFSKLPGYVSIGERSCGAMGIVIKDNYNALYSGAFGNSALETASVCSSTDVNYYCYMSLGANVDADTGECPEGIGMIPQIEVLLDTTAMFSGRSDNQLLEAVKYIKNLKNRQ